MYKTILTVIRSKEEAGRVLDFAIRVAEANDAHLIVAHSEPAPFVYATPDGIAAAEYYDRMIEAGKERTAEIKAACEESCRKAGISSEWRAAISAGGDRAGAAISTASTTDLIIAGQTDPDANAGTDYDLERLLFETGRPVLMVPSAGSYDPAPKNVLVAWNGSREAARSVFDALPFLKAAKKVEVLMVDPQASDDTDAGAIGYDIAAALTRHGIEVNVQSVPSGGIPAGEVIENRISETGAELLVMGAYGRSRLRELIFGGVTRTLLASMTAPVLMSH